MQLPYGIGQEVPELSLLRVETQGWGLLDHRLAP